MDPHRQPENRMNRHLRSWSFVLGLAASIAAPGVGSETASAVTTLYVSTEGNDAWSGSLPAATPDRSDGPLQSLGAARDRLRKQPTPAGARVIVRGGTYSLSEPLRFDPADSGAEGAPRSYEAYPGEKVVLAGTKRINGPWRLVGPNLYETDLGSSGWAEASFRTLFIDGHRATWARYPNAGYIEASGGQEKTVIELPAGAAKPAWASDPHATVNIIAEHGWYNQIVKIAAIDPTGSRIELSGRERQGRIWAGNRFYVEGIRAELDHEGEWYLDRAAAKLYFYSQTNPADRQLEAAVIDRLIDVRGTLDRPVTHVGFRGLELFGSDFTVDHVAVRTNQDAAIHLVNARGVEITGCRFVAVGGYAVWLHLDARDNVIRGNEMVAGGAGGVLLTGALFSYLSGQDVYDDRAEAQGLAPTGNVILENHIHHGGVVRAYCSGVHLDSRPETMAQAVGNYIGFNHIHDMPRNGIFAFRNQGGNIFEANHIHDVLQRTNDGGAIHIASMNPLSSPTHILNNRIYRVGYQGGATNVVQSFGIYPDWFTSRMVIRGNVVTDTRDCGIRLLGSSDAVIEDNVVGDDPTASVVFGCWTTDSVEGLILRNNLVVNGSGHWVRYYTDRSPALIDRVAASPAEFWESAHNRYGDRGTGLGRILVAKSARHPMRPGDVELSLSEMQQRGGELLSAMHDSGADGAIDTSVDPKRFGAGSATFRRMERPRGTEDARAGLDELAGVATFVAFDDAARVVHTADWQAEPTKITEFLAFADLTQAVSRTTGGAISFATELTPGTYEVYVKWYGDPAERAAQIEIELSDASSVAHVERMDHRQEAHKWLKVGVVTADGTGSHRVTLRNVDGGLTGVNAVAWTQLKSP